MKIQILVNFLVFNTSRDDLNHDVEKSFMSLKFKIYKNGNFYFLFLSALFSAY